VSASLLRVRSHQRRSIVNQNRLLQIVSLGDRIGTTTLSRHFAYRPPAAVGNIGACPKGGFIHRVPTPFRAATCPDLLAKESAYS
jgi:hypothetical protein